MHTYQLVIIHNTTTTTNNNNNNSRISKAIIREATDNQETGISVVGHIINTIRYADNKAVAASSQKGLQQLMNNLNKVNREFGMKINVKKMKVMCISRKGNNKLKIYVDG